MTYNVFGGTLNLAQLNSPDVWRVAGHHEGGGYQW